MIRLQFRLRRSLGSKICGRAELTQSYSFLSRNIPIKTTPGFNRKVRHQSTSTKKNDDSTQDTQTRVGQRQTELGQAELSQPSFYGKSPHIKASQRKVLDQLLKEETETKTEASGSSVSGHKMLKPEKMEQHKRDQILTIGKSFFMGMIIVLLTMHFTRTKMARAVAAQSQASSSASTDPVRIATTDEIVEEKDQEEEEKEEPNKQRVWQQPGLKIPFNKIEPIRISRSKPRIIEDPDPEFDPQQSEKYKQEVEEAKNLNLLVEQDDIARSQNSRLQKVLRVLFMKMTDSGDQNIKRRERKRLARRFRPVAPTPRTSSRITIGTSQVFQEKTKSDRFGLGIIKVHNTKFFYAGVMDGYNGWQIAEYVRQTLPKRLEEAIGNSPLFLIRDAIAGAFIKLEDDLKEAIAGAKDLKMTNALSVGRVYKLLNIDEFQMGCCVVLALIDPNSIVVANAGTSKAVISREGMPYRLTRWHSASTLLEQRLLVKAVQREDNALKCSRQKDVKRKVEGPLAVPFWLSNTQGYDTMYLDCLIKGMSPASRALGHFQLKDPEFGKLFPEMSGSKAYPYVSAIPTVTVFPRTKYDEFLIIASGGFWEAVEEAEAVGMVHGIIQDLCETVGPESARDYGQIAAERLMQAALQNHKALASRDLIGERQDMTVLVIPLNVETVVGVPELNEVITEEETSFLKILKNKIFGSSEDVFKIADWETKLKGHHERQIVQKSSE